MAACALLTVGAGGCSVSQVNQAVFGVATDLPTTLFDSVQITLSSGGAPFVQKQVPILSMSLDAGLPGDFVVYTTGKALPTVDVAVDAMRAGAQVVTRQARVTLLPEQSRFVRLALEARCIGVLCAADQTCVEGSCQPIDVDLGRAIPYRSGQEFVEDCDDPMFRYSYDDSPLDGPDGGCAPAQACVEGTCYQPAGAAPIAGAGELAEGELGDFQVPASSP
jgi:hypothetical protein